MPHIVSMEREAEYLRMEKVITLPKLYFTNAKQLGKFTTFSTFSHILKTSLCQFHYWYNMGYTQFKFSSIREKPLLLIVITTEAYIFEVYKGLSHTYLISSSQLCLKEAEASPFYKREGSSSRTVSDKTKNQC